jgi:HSP20 family molecular chaperone IbpA
MWADACSMLEQAERLHRQFFLLGRPRGARTSWQPPVDIFEDDASYTIVVALPGCPADRVEVVFDAGTLVVRASCDMPFARRDCAIHQLEIPYGYFERRVALPAGTFELAQRELKDGCLTLVLRKAQ